MPVTAQAHASFAAASSAGNTSDKYVRLTVILATILFLLGISGHFTVRARVFALNARAKDVVGPALLDDLRGRVPQTLLITATAVDPSGGGLAILSWVTYWPAFATVLGGIPLVLITRAGAGAMLVAAAWTVAATAALVFLLSRDPVET